MDQSTSNIALLREKLGEVISQGGDETETFFSDDQLKAILERSSSMDRAILDGWETKLAHWANLVTVVDGASSRELSKLMEHGEKMIKIYQGKVDTDDNLHTRARVGKIVRR